jgi:hypothetical protein
MNSIKPHPGMVVHYEYLWHSEHESGLEDGHKARRCIVIDDENGIVTVSPITHKQPAKIMDGIEIPENVKTLLNMDQDRSWVICTEVNRFSWVGPDLKNIPRKKSFVHGTIPNSFYQKVLQRISYNSEGGVLKTIARTV